MKNIIGTVVAIIMLAGIVYGVTDCQIVGHCNKVSVNFFDQTYMGATIENTSVNITINSSSTATGWCNVSCVTQKAWGNYTFDNNTMANISFCNIAASLVENGIKLYMLNQTAGSNDCNTTYSIQLNGTDNTTIYFNPNQSRAGTSGYPLIYKGAGALGGVTIAYLWLKKRRT